MDKDDELLERIVEALFIGMRRHLSHRPISELSESTGMTEDRVTRAVLVLSKKEKALKLPTRQRAAAEEDAFLEEVRKRIAAEVFFDHYDKVLYHGRRMPAVRVF